LLCAVLGLDEWIQFIVFLLSSIALLWYTRPIAKKYLKIGSYKTNAEGLVGREAIVIEKIEKFKTGQVKVNGQYWTAVSYEQKTIEADSTVVIKGIEGVKLIVEEVISDNNNSTSSYDFNPENKEINEATNSTTQSSELLQTPDAEIASNDFNENEQSTHS